MLTGEKRRQTVGVKDKQGVLRSEKSDGMERWKEHFSEILNRDAPIDPITEDEIEDVEEIEEIDTGRLRISEARSALKRTRSGNAAGINQVGPELLKAKTEVPRDVRDSKVRKQDKFMRDWSQH